MSEELKDDKNGSPANNGGGTRLTKTAMEQRNSVFFNKTELPNALAWLDTLPEGMQFENFSDVAKYLMRYFTENEAAQRSDSVALTELRERISQMAEHREMLEAKLTQLDTDYMQKVSETAKLVTEIGTLKNGSTGIQLQDNQAVFTLTPDMVEEFNRANEIQAYFQGVTPNPETLFFDCLREHNRIYQFVKP